MLKTLRSGSCINVLICKEKQTGATNEHPGNKTVKSYAEGKWQEETARKTNCRHNNRSLSL
jgi:hypothetical protein